MPLIDDRGRVFGRINVIDAAVAAFALLLVPLAYTAYALFRVPLPHITAVEPPTLVATGARNTQQRVRLRGEYLRPFLRATVGPFEAQILSEKPDSAELRFLSLEVGSYDLRIYDIGQLLVHVPDAITVVAPAETRQTVDVTARFVSPPEVAEMIQVGTSGTLAGRDAADRASAGGDATLLCAVVARRLIRGFAPIGLDVDPGRSMQPQVAQPLVEIDAMLRLSAAETAQGWRHNGHLVKAGRSVSFDAPRYTLWGRILDARPASGSPPGACGS